MRRRADLALATRERYGRLRSMLVSAFDSTKAGLLKDAEDATEITAAAGVIEILAEALRDAAKADSDGGTLVLEPADPGERPEVVARAVAGLEDLGLWLPAAGGGIPIRNPIGAMKAAHEWGHYDAEGIIKQISAAL